MEKETKEQRSIKSNAQTKCMTTSNHEQNASLSSAHAATKISPCNGTWLPSYNCWICLELDIQLWIQVSATGTSAVLTDTTNSSNFRKITSLYPTKFAYSETPDETHDLLRKQI